jgi:predicted transcriptional regulator
MTKEIDENQCINAFVALGQETRFKIFLILCQAKDRGVRQIEIINILGTDPGTLISHLKKLEAANLIIRTKVAGKNATYKANIEVSSKLFKMLSCLCDDSKFVLPLELKNNKSI